MNYSLRVIYMKVKSTLCIDKELMLVTDQEVDRFKSDTFAILTDTLVDLVHRLIMLVEPPFNRLFSSNVNQSN